MRAWSNLLASVTMAPFVLLCFVCSCVWPAVATAGSIPLAVVGSVITSEDAYRFIEVQAVDGATGAVVRSVPLDATLTFTFHGLPQTVSEVRLLPRLPERRFRLDSSASVLTAPLRTKDGDGWLHLSAIVEQQDGSQAGDQLPGSISAAVMAAMIIALAVIGRYRLLSLFQFPAPKPPKLRRVAVAVNR
ncbi:hypothetical protein, conserved [Trypanosoma brucei gambiense DAL972]|uniref:T. brucei spp.-specific protein n=2 Tax=Trypanosoma brucei TaxID=5691 RepID=C9ZQP6_TRYB9|nr:hypothetical protein, conserved [Trypanosoma brucei gambiense DAL972]XP_011774015.1 hypothetical protein, conserved [Trypanosoma brucei gambiense DAL972]RHW71828.1 hypothetical protein DPX39_060025700 [Trypanosoma brucei equiperdum]RHW71928.1 hypothetical protein DPX39_060026100 [Trypanosoma brucei equiperdum]CBH11726.1 hypothetical protein, conserved [Trypanosoma brucei gambiense DAL972]CBH11730.1 hypothetical protein, conserved [Trypanosoma brucei gambiense DAL972]|eukprot:XP_011774011.1 hypothetical protein, conserved [Trypanosoma brucei gambiense DAL972]